MTSQALSALPSSVHTADPNVADVIDNLTSRLQAGEAVDVEACIAEHPEWADSLRRLLPAVAVLADLGRSLGGSEKRVVGDKTDQAGVCLGDFRILREAGRGGMGVVYEAEQISLRRRVALKVLPMAGALDTRHLQRFKNEAQAAAGLHHTNIVPVHYVGCDRGIHYYAMQYIEGQSLAALISEMRRREKGERAPVSDAAYSLNTGSRLGAKESIDMPPTIDATPTEALAASTAPIAAISTEHSTKNPAYFQSVAKLAIQAAEALEHAHQMGVVHRDIKPGNLLLDERGNIWVADFGLAQFNSEANLTMTGDILGTLRYMSPEQSLAQRVIIDHRTDIYSLGVTLYELLTLRPAIAGKARPEILRQIAFEDPKAPRKLNKAIPPELETIVMKAMEKNPADRYQTAQGLADDLRRFVEDKPIHARRPGMVTRTRKWARRNQSLVWSAAACLIVGALVLGGAIGWIESERSGRNAQLNKDVSGLLEEVERRRGDIHAQLADPVYVSLLLSDIDSWKDALDRARVGWRQANTLAASNQDVCTPELDQRLHEADENLHSDEADWRLAKELDDIRLEASTLIEGKFDTSRAGPKYAKVFASHGLDFKEGQAELLSERIRSLRLRFVLVAALDCWATVNPRKELLPAMLETARLADPDAWRDQVRDFKNWQNKAALEKLSLEVDFSRQSPHVLTLLGVRLRPKSQETATFLRHVLVFHPRDFWLNFHLGNTTKDAGEQVGCYRAALATRPNSFVAYNNLGCALDEKKDLTNAIRHFEKALVLAPNFIQAHINLGNSLRAKKDLEGAIRHFNKALELDATDALTRINFGVALHDKNDLEGAIRHYEKAIELLGLQHRADPEGAIRDHQILAAAYNNLGVVVRQKKDLEGASRILEKAIELDPDDAEAHFNLGLTLHDKLDLAGAIRHLEKVIQLDATHLLAHDSLGTVLVDNKDLSGAIRHYEKAIELDPRNAKIYTNFGIALYLSKDLAGAIRCYEKAIAFDPNLAKAHYNLGLALDEENDTAGAIRHYKRAIEIDPNHSPALNNLGSALFYAPGDKRDLDGAIHYYTRAAVADPDNVKAHFNLGLSLRARKDHSGAIRHFKKAIAIAPNFVEAHFHLGLTLNEANDKAAAIRHYKRAIEIDPNYSPALNNLGNVLLSAPLDRRDLDGAIRYFERAIAADPDYANARYNLGVALSQKNDKARAIRCFRRAIAIAPKFVEAHFYLGLALFRSGDVPGAIVAYEKAIALKSDLAEAHCNLAWCLVSFADPKLRDVTRALKLAQKAVDLAPTVAPNSLGNCVSTLGAVQYRAGNYKAALNELEKAMSLQKDGDSNDWFILAMAHWQLGEKEHARKWYDRAVAWMDKNQPKDLDLRRFRTEAAQLLGVPEAPKKGDDPKKEQKKSPSP